jgi:hypothetical protein
MRLLLIAAKDSVLRLRRMAGEGPLLNPVFTRVVNHCVIAVGLEGIPRPIGSKEQRLFGRYSRVLMSNMRCRLEKKPIPCSILGRFVGKRPERTRALESGFVNHASLKFRLGLSQSVFEGRRCGVPT